MSECADPVVFTIVQGEDRTLSLIVRLSNGSSFPLAGVTEITARFRKTDGTFLEKLLSLTQVVVTDAPAGKFTVALTDADTLLIRVGALQTFEVYFDFGTTRRIARYVQRLTVEGPL